MAVRSSINTQYAPGQNPYDTYVSLEGAAKDIDAGIERGQKLQERQEQARLREMQLAEIKSKNMAGLMISSETEFEPLQGYMQSMSRNLVDKYSGLVSQLEKGEIDSTYFAAESAKLQGQVPQVKGMVDAISATAGMYSEGLSQGTLSGAIPKDQEMYFQAILNNKGSFGMDENNVLVFQGETADGEPFSIPANKLNQMPQPIGKVDDFQALVLPTVQTLMKPEERNVGGRVVNASVIGPSADNPAGSQEWQNGIAASFDTFLQTQGENGLKSLAVDHAGYTIQEMNDALNSGSYEGNDGEQYSSRLEYEMEKKFTEQAGQNYELVQFENFNQLQADRSRKTQQIQAMNAETNRINALSAQTQGRTKPERAIIANIKSVEQKSAPRTTGNLEEDIRSINENFLLDVPGMRIDADEDGIFLVNPKGDGIPISESVWKDPNLLASWLAANAMGIPSGRAPVFNFETAPIGGGASPMQKIANFFTGKK